MSDVFDHSALENSPKLKPYYDNKRLFYSNAFWFLFGNAAAVFGQQTGQTLMPLHMANVKLDSQQISFIMATSGYLGMPLLLYISHLTDHWQWRWGRRLPFLAMALPFMLLGLVLFPHAAGFWSCIALYGMYCAFNNIKYTTYPYLINDISKQHYWGRMAGLATVAGCIGMWLGQFFLMPMVPMRGEKSVFTAGAAFVATATILTLIFVREPPIRSDEPPRLNPVPAIWAVLRFGFSTKKRILTCIAYGLICAAGLSFYYVPLQAKVNLGLNEGQIGRDILQYGTFASCALAFFAGYVIDRLGVIKSMAIGYTLLFCGTLLGVSPMLSSKLVNSTFGLNLTPVVLLSAAYICSYVSSPFTFSASTVFIMSSVHRKDVATMCACTGSVNLLMQSTLMAVSGWVIKHFFGGNYGFVFIMSVAMVSIGIPLFFVLDSWQKRNAGKRTASAEQADTAPAAVRQDN